MKEEVERKTRRDGRYKKTKESMQELKDMHKPARGVLEQDPNVTYYSGPDHSKEFSSGDLREKLGESIRLQQEASMKRALESMRSHYNQYADIYVVRGSDGEKKGVDFSYNTYKPAEERQNVVPNNEREEVLKARIDDLEALVDEYQSGKTYISGQKSVIKIIEGLDKIDSKDDLLVILNKEVNG